MDGASIGVIKSRQEYLERLWGLLTGSTIMPLERTNALMEDSMVTANLGEEIYSAEMLIFMRLHRTAAMCLDDDSVLSV